MKPCLFCGHQNREGALFCVECGKGLHTPLNNVTYPTRQLGGLANGLSAKATWGTARFSKRATVVMHIREAVEPLVLEPAQYTLLGRQDTNSPKQPDIDLTPYGALEKGVSRLHAAIERSQDTLTLVDLGSSNGTLLNGQKLVPDQPRVLRDGDEIRLGKLIAHIYFK
jgi:hypothetical protein